MKDISLFVESRDCLLTSTDAGGNFVESLNIALVHMNEVVAADD